MAAFFIAHQVHKPAEPKPLLSVRSRMNQPVNPRREHMSTLKKFAAASLVIVAAAATAQGLSAQRSSPENEELKAKVAELQVRLNALEARVEAMNKPRLQKAAP